MILKIRLAWLQLIRKKSRLIVALAGIAFADILMFMQIGFQDALFTSAAQLHSNLQGEIFLISTQSTALIAMKSFSQRRLYQALSFDSVEAVSPVYIDKALWKNPQNKSTRGILVIGFNPKLPVVNLPEVKQNLDKIKIPDIVLFDRASRAQFGSIAAEFEQGENVITEVGNRRIKVGGIFSLGASFGSDGNILTSDLTFLRIFPKRQLGLIDIGAIKLKPGANVAKAIKDMTANLQNDVKVLSHQDFIDFEKNYWKTGTAIGFIFTLGTTMGFAVGTVIVYQILYTGVADHLPEYATLKAMGYTDFYLLGIVFQEALILAVLGYIPGFLFSQGLYNLTKNATSLPMAMSIERASLLLALTILMCCVSGLFAVQKLRAADPADIF
jgi:putative ABC transport system permease protein